MSKLISHHQKAKIKKITLPHWESASPVENKKKIIKLMKN
jgi:hypothetical protein